MKILIISLLAVVFFQTNLLAVTPSGVSEVLLIDAQTVELGSECGNVKITIVADGEVVDQFETKKKGKFQYYFDANTYYEIVFEKAGYITKTIEINTYTGKLKNGLQDFNFNVEMAQGSEKENDEIAKIFVPKNGKKFTYAKL